MLWATKLVVALSALVVTTTLMYWEILPAPLASSLLKDVDLMPITDQCVQIRVRGEDESFPWDRDLLEGRTVGVEFLEAEDGFHSIAKHDVFHYYHFMEFLVMAYTLVPASSTVSWLYVPHMSTDEICGLAGGMNCLIAKMMLGEQVHVHGLESNPELLQEVHPVYRGESPKRIAFAPEPWVPLPNQDDRYREMQREVDAVVLIHRRECLREQHKRMHKMWSNYMDDFPFERWSQVLPHSSNDRLVVAYIDRQNTSRRLPDAMHEWLIHSLAHMDPRIDFRQLHMEDLQPMEQFQAAAQADVLLGVHGNGLTHLFWMPPNRYVVEMYDHYPFQYDYASAAQMMQHRYLGLSNGRVLNEVKIRNRDAKMLGVQMKEDKDWNEGKQAIERLIREAMDTLL